jgi:L-ascorbate peroxidase
VDAGYMAEIERTRRDLRALISSKSCAPIMLRLAYVLNLRCSVHAFFPDNMCHARFAKPCSDENDQSCRWHDAGTYDKRTKTGGPNGSIRFPQEYSHAANAGIKIAIDLLGQHLLSFSARCPLSTFVTSALLPPSHRAH